MSRRTYETPVEELRTRYTYNGRVSEKHKTTVQQKKTKPTRTEGWRLCMAGEQKYLVKLTLKEVG